MTFKQTLKRGSMLVDIVIALAIMAVIGGVVIPNLLSYLRRANVSATEQTLANTQMAIKTYYTHTGEYPQSLTDLVRRPSQVPSNKWYGPYFEGKDEEFIPKDGWKNELYYRLVDQKSSTKPYELYSYGPNGEDGDDSDRIYAS